MSAIRRKCEILIYVKRTTVLLVAHKFYITFGISKLLIISYKLYKDCNSQSLKIAADPANESCHET